MSCSSHSLSLIYVINILHSAAFLHINFYCLSSLVSKQLTRSRMAGFVPGKYRRHSEDLATLSTSKRQDSLCLFDTSVTEPPSSSPSASIVPPHISMNFRRRTITCMEFPLYPPRQPSRDRQRLCSPTRRSNPHPAGFAYQRPYNRHHKVRMVDAGRGVGSCQYAVLKLRACSLKLFLVCAVFAHVSGL